MLLSGVFALWCVVVVTSRKVLRSPLNPMTVFATAWLACVSLYQSDLVQLFAPSRGEQLLLLGGVTATLAGGYVVTCGVRHAAWVARERSLPSALIIGIGALAFAGFGYLVLALSRKVSLLVYWVAPERVESLGFQVPVVGYLNLLHIVLPALLVLQGRRTRRYRAMWYAVAVLSLLTTPFAGIKAYFVQATLTLAFAALYDARRHTARAMSATAAILALVVFGYFVFYDDYFDDQYVDYIGEGVVDLPRSAEPLSRPLIYVTGPIATFGPFTRFQEDVYYGRATFRGASRLVQAFEPVTLPSFNAEHYSVPIPFNTYSAFREYYEDGREAGVLILGFVTGLFVQLVYVLTRSRASLPLVVLVAYLTTAQALSPFVGFLAAPQAVFLASVLLGLHLLTTPWGRHGLSAARPVVSRL